MDIKWYYRRFRAMNTEERIYRMRKILRSRIDILFEWSGLGSRYHDYKTEKAVKKILEDWDKEIIFPELRGKEEKIKKFKKLFPGIIEKIDLEAQKILSGNIRIFNMENVPFGSREQVNWNRDPETFKCWPVVNILRLDHNNTNFGGVRCIWELNRHEHLLKLSLAYYLTGNERYAEETVFQLNEWLLQNPFLKGINWYSPLELAARSLVWIFIIGFLNESKSLDLNFKGQMIKCILKKQKQIQKNLSRFSSGNNHLIGEAASLLIAGLNFRSIEKAEKWFNSGFRILCDEVKNQIFPDGVGREQSTQYLAWVLEFYSLAWIHLKKAGLDFSDEVKSRIYKGVYFLRETMNCDGEMLQTGDSDDSMVLPLLSNTYDRYYSLLNSFALLFEDTELIPPQKQLDIKTFWLFEDRDILKYFNLLKMKESVREYKSKGFEHGGIYVMRSGSGKKENLLIFDCGQLGFPPLYAHGHADSLGIVFSLNGTQILVDPGTYKYHDGGIWREYLRSTAAHNTVTVDGANQSVQGGPFLWKSHAETHVKSWYSNHYLDYVEAWHDGFLRLEKKIIHSRRIIFVKPFYFILLDMFTGNNGHLVEEHFHFNSGILQKNSDKGIEFFSGNKCFRLIPLWEEAGVRDFDEKIYYGNEDPLKGWISPKFGVKYPSYSLVYSGRVSVPSMTGVLFWAYDLPEQLNKITIRKNNINSVKDLKYPELTLSILVETPWSDDEIFIGYSKDTVIETDDFIHHGILSIVRKGHEFGKNRYIHYKSSMTKRRRKIILQEKS